MVNVEALFVLLDLSHSFKFLLVVAWQVFYICVRSDKLNLILLAYDLARVFGFVIFLRYVA